METYNDLENRLLKLERKEDADFNNIVFTDEDNDSIEDNKGIFNFKGLKAKRLAINLSFTSSTQDLIKIYLNDVIIWGYKPVIGKNDIYLTAETLIGNNSLKILTTHQQITDLSVQLNGYISTIYDNQLISLLRLTDKTLFVFSNNKVHTVYAYTNLLESKFRFTGKSCSISKLGNDKILIGLCDDQNNFKVCIYDHALDLLGDFTQIDDGVNQITGVLNGDCGGFYAIKNQKVVYYQIDDRLNVSVENTNIKSAVKIVGSPNVNDSIIVIGYDKTATLHKFDFPQNNNI